MAYYGPLYFLRAKVSHNILNIKFTIYQQKKEEESGDGEGVAMLVCQALL